MAAGARLLDATGKLLLQSDGKVHLSDGAGDDCCCDYVEPCNNCASGTTPAIVTVTFAGLSNASCGCLGAFLRVGGSYEYSNSPGVLSGTFELVKETTFFPVADGGNSCVYSTGLAGVALPPGLSAVYPTASTSCSATSPTADRLHVWLWFQSTLLTVSARVGIGGEYISGAPLFYARATRTTTDCGATEVVSNTGTCSATDPGERSHNTGGTATVSG